MFYKFQHEKQIPHVMVLETVSGKCLIQKTAVVLSYNLLSSQPFRHYDKLHVQWSHSAIMVKIAVGACVRPLKTIRLFKQQKDDVVQRR